MFIYIYIYMYKNLLHRLEIEFCKFIRYHIIIYNLLVIEITNFVVKLHLFIYKLVIKY